MQNLDDSFLLTASVGRDGKLRCFSDLTEEYKGKILIRQFVVRGITDDMDLIYRFVSLGIECGNPPTLRQFTDINRNGTFTANTIFTGSITPNENKDLLDLSFINENTGEILLNVWSDPAYKGLEIVLFCERVLT